MPVRRECEDASRLPPAASPGSSVADAAADTGAPEVKDGVAEDEEVSAADTAPPLPVPPRPDIGTTTGTAWKTERVESSDT